MHEVELVERVYARFQYDVANGCPKCEVGIAKGTVDQIVHATLEILKIPMLPAGVINIPSMPATVEVFYVALEGGSPTPKPEKPVKPATGKKPKRRGRR